MDFRPNPGHTRGGHEHKKPHKPDASGFSALGLRPELLRTVEKIGWASPSPIQHDAIPHALAGHDLIAIAQTGTGKTGAFALPLLQMLAELPPAKPLHPYVVILAPTRELVQQIDAQFKALGAGSKVRSMTIFGGVSDRPQISQLNMGAEIICATPGRLLDLMGKGWVHFEKLTHCVLDEADRMFDMGFILDLKRILNRMPSRRQTLLFSATMPPEIQALANEFLYKPREVRMGTTAPPAELTHELWEMEPEQKNAALDLLLEDDVDSILVFTRTKHRADSVARRLVREGMQVAVLHSNRSQNQRDIALARFKEGKAKVLVATDVASRGLDIEGIGLVINYDTPRDPDDYVHRVGRTARAKRPGRAVTLITMDEFKYVKKIEQLIKQRISRRTQALPRIEHDANMPPPDRERGARGRQSRPEPEPRITRSERKARNQQLGLSPASTVREERQPRADHSPALQRQPAGADVQRGRRNAPGGQGNHGRPTGAQHNPRGANPQAKRGGRTRVNGPSSRGGDAGVSASSGHNRDYGYSD